MVDGQADWAGQEGRATVTSPVNGHLSGTLCR